MEIFQPTSDNDSAYVPYTGATSDVNLGIYSLTATGITNSSMTLGSVLFAGTAGIMSQDNSNFFWNNTTKRLGLGTTTPLAKLHISDGNTGGSAFVSSDDLIMSKQGGAMGFNIAVASSASITDRGVFKGTRSRGTLASPTAVASGDYTFSLLGTAYDGSTFRATAGLEMIVDTAPVSNTSVGQAIAFQTGTTSRAERMRISSAGSVGIGDTSPSSNASRLSIVGGTGTTGIPFQHLSGTLSTTGSGTGAQYLITSPATAGTYSHAGLRVEFLAGYTGTGATRAFYSDNQVAGTGSDLRWNTSYSSPAGNSGGNMWASATTTGTNVGNFAEAKGGNVNVGLFGKAAAVKNSATNIGVIGHGRNTGTSPIQVGGWFSLANTAPTFVSAALVADNGDQTSPIFLARDNSTTVFSIIDGGNVGIKTTSPTAVVDINSDILRLRTAKTPSSASDTGNAGDICWDTNYIYHCVATNTWKRAAIATW